MWNREVFGNLNFQIDAFKEEVRSLDIKYDQGVSHLTKTEDKTRVITNFWSLLRVNDSLMIQISRSIS